MRTGPDGQVHSLSRRGFLAAWWFAALAGVLSKVGARAGTIIGDQIGAWRGHIGADSEVLQQKIDFEAFMVGTDPTRTPVECIDGRKPLDTYAPVGAKISGWAVSLQAAFALMGQPLTDEEALEKFTRDLPYLPGCHIDTDHRNPDAAEWEGILNTRVPWTGCGANDKLSEILRNFKAYAPKLKPIVQQLLGSDFDPSLFDWLVGKTLNDIPHDPQNLASRIWAQIRQRGAVDVLDAGNHAPNHNHRESYVIFNFIRYRTLDNTRLQKAHKDVQAFCVDMWLLKDIAGNLFPEDEQMRKECLHALVAYQVATYYTLADGTQRSVIIN